MLLIADSGASKADWRVVINSQKIISFQTEGISPQFQTEENIYLSLKNHVLPHLHNTKIESVYFYGAGCEAPQSHQSVLNAFKMHFKDSKIEIAHDLLAAAKALSGDERGTICILGTGSNACFYNGSTISEKRNNLGFWLGDEGSGGYLGKTLVVAFMHEELPDHLMKEFRDRYALTRDELIYQVFHNPFPSRYLGKYSTFLSDNIDDEFCRNLVYQSFSLFLDKYVCKLSEHKAHAIHFVGSIAYYYQEILIKLLKDRNLKKGNILLAPIEELTKYHLSKNSIAI